MLDKFSILKKVNKHAMDVTKKDTFVWRHQIL